MLSVKIAKGMKSDLKEEKKEELQEFRFFKSQIKVFLEEIYKLSTVSLSHPSFLPVPLFPETEAHPCSPSYLLSHSVLSPSTSGVYSISPSEVESNILPWALLIT